jgi:WD40 repeat protein
MIRSIVRKCLTLLLRVAVVGVAVLGVAMLGVAGLGAGQAQDGAKSAATDRNGDLLPAGALARLGSLRWRHEGPILFVAFVQDGKAVLTGGQDQVFRLWDRATGAEIRHFAMQANPPGKPGKPRPVAMPWTQQAQVIASVTHDGKTLAVYLPGNAILLWDVDTGKEIRRFTPPQNPIAGLQFSPDGKLLAARSNNNSGVIFLLDPASGKEVRQVKPEGPAGGGVRNFGLGMPSSLAFSPDNKLLAVSEAEFDQQKVHYHVRVNEVDSGKEVIKFTTPTNTTSIAFSADAKTIAIGNFNSIVLREPATGKEIRSINPTNGAMGMVFAPQGALLAVRGRDHHVRLIDSETGKQLHVLTAAGMGDDWPGATIRIGMPNVPRAELAFAPDGKSLAVASGNTLRIWDTATGKDQPLTDGHRGPVTNLGVSADGKRALTRGADGVIRHWDLTDGRQLGEFGEPSHATAIAFSPDGKWAAFGTTALIQLCDTETGKPVKELRGHTNLTATLAFSPDGKWLASFGMTDNTLRIHDLAKISSAKVDSAKVEPRAIALGDNPPPGGGFVVRGSAIFGSSIHLAFSADSKSVAVQTSATGQAGISVNIGNGPGALPEPKIRMWDVATGKEMRQFPLALPSGAGTIAASRDGRLIATENSDQTATLWEIATGQPRRRLGKADTSRQIASGIGVGLGAGAVVPRAANPATTIAFSPDGRLFADAGFADRGFADRGADHAVRVWDVTAGKEIGQFKGHQGSITALAFSPDSRRLITGSSDTTLLVWDVGTLKPVPAAAVAELKGGDLESCWGKLLIGDGEKAYDAILKLAGSPRLAVPYLAERIRPATPADPSKLKKLIVDLDSDDFTERANAAEELEKLGELALPALQKALTGKPTIEFRRRAEPMVTRLIGGVLNGEQVRMVRALEVLERSGTPEARHLLESLAKGAPGVLVTRKAQESLERIGR